MEYQVTSSSPCLDIPHEVISPTILHFVIFGWPLSSYAPLRLCQIGRGSHDIVPRPPPGVRPPPASRWGQQRALKAALLAALGAACCIAFLRAGLPFRDQSTHPDEDPFLQVIVPPLPSSARNPLCFHLIPLPSSRSMCNALPALPLPPHSAAHLPLSAPPPPRCLNSPFCSSRPSAPVIVTTGRRGRSGGRCGGGWVAGDGRGELEGVCGRSRRTASCHGWVIRDGCVFAVFPSSLPTLALFSVFAPSTSFRSCMLPRANLPCICSAVCAAGRGGEEQGSFLLVQLAGGLNQMRAGICDAVVVAKLLGASLMLPQLDNSSWWADGSTFADVFDAGHFARALAPWVRVVDRLPSALRHRPALERTVPRGSTAEYYETHVRPMIRKAQVLKLNHFDSRLHDQLPLDLQKLRCMANYEALRFVPAVTQAVTRLTHALTHPSATTASTALHTAKHAAQAGGAAVAAAAAAQGAQGQGGEREQVEGGMQAKGSGKAVKYVAIHLRYEPDMLAFTGCEYEGGAEEKAVFESIRQRWANLPAMDAEKQRAKGMCIVTPSQVAVALQALGLPPSTRVYIASGALHGGPAALQPLLRAFPFTTDKHSLAHSHAMAHAHTRGRDDDEDEGDEAWGGGEGGGGKGGVGAEGGGALAGVEGRKTLLAAVDYEMCRGAALLVTNNKGNMAHLLAGHRRYNGVGGTVHLFGSSIHRLLAAIQQGDHEASQKLRNRLLKGDLSTQTESNEKAAAKGGFYAFPRDCLCEV
ncbi:unnamed protein product [Closterium sp. Naga37s-1]|nr:unnamed protein product [Closterium sp. Naga37s-1]